MITRLSLALLLFAVPCFANAECVEGAMMKSKYSRMNVHTIALTGGYGDAIVIRTSCKIKRSSNIVILQDAFCSETEAVLNVDGTECDAKDVYLGDKLSDNALDGGDEWDFPVD